MAIYYVRSLASGAGTGADWTNAYTTLALAISTAPSKVAGDTYYVSEDHAESTASAVSLTFPGTAAAPDRIICVNHAGTVPPVSADLRTTATVSTTLASAIALNGFFYCYGIAFQSCVGSVSSSGNIALVNTAGNQQRFDSCAFRCQNTATGSNVTTANTTGLFLNNCTFRFGNIGQIISCGRTRFIWSNSSLGIDNTGQAPTTLFNTVAGSFIVLEGVDLTTMISGKTIFGSAANTPTDMMLKDCKLVNGVIISAAQTGGVGMGDVRVIRSDPSVNYRTERHNYAGDMIIDTTVLRTGGATDGTQGVSWRVITTANSRWADPFTCLPISIWNDVAGSAVTATVYGTWATGTAVPNKEDIWADFEYLGDAASPLGSMATSGNTDILATAPCTSDASTWSGTPAGGGTQTKFKFAQTFTPQKKGPITVYVRCAKPSVLSGFYIDPKVVLT